MLELGKNVGVRPLKFETHQSHKTLDGVIYRANDLLYFFANCYITPKVKTFILGRFAKMRDEAKSLYLNGPSDRRRNEFIDKLYDVGRSLNAYTPSTDEREIQNACDRMCKFRVARYLKERDGMTMDQKIELMKTNLTFSKFYPVSQSMQRMQTELTSMFCF